MSYDLFFKPRQGLFDEKEFHRYFQGRANYRCEGTQAWYGNEDTGVYFVFDLQTENASAGEGQESCPVALNINYLRPSYFIFEAEPEVSAFVSRFDLLVTDPQIDGMGEGEYDAAKLVSGWNSGNEFGYSSILGDRENRHEVFHLPTRQLHDAWRWNFSRSAVQRRFGEAIFVPRIFFMNLGGTTITACVWPDGIPVMVRPVDQLWIPRKLLAPTKFFRKKEDTTFLAWEQALPVLQKHGTRNDDGSIVLNYRSPPADVVKFVQSLPADARACSTLPPDKVLDRELYERCAG